MKLGLSCKINGVAILELRMVKTGLSADVRLVDVNAAYIHQTKDSIHTAGQVVINTAWPKHLIDRAEELVALLEDHLAKSPVFGSEAGTNYFRKDEPKEGIV